jgi:hypothetical protein
MTHLKPDELIDAAEERLSGDRRRHLDACDLCRTQVADLTSALGEAGEVGIPEPSPLFWEHFSARVRAAIDAEPAPGPWHRWLQLPRAARVVCVALPLLVLVLFVPRLVRTPVGDGGAAMTVEGETPLPDESFALVADLVGPLDWETAGEAGLALAPGTADRAALELNAQERHELRRLLEAELERLKSS